MAPAALLRYGIFAKVLFVKMTVSRLSSHVANFLNFADSPRRSDVFKPLTGNNRRAHLVLVPTPPRTVFPGFNQTP